MTPKITAGCQPVVGWKSYRAGYSFTSRCEMTQNLSDRAFIRLLRVSAIGAAVCLALSACGSDDSGGREQGNGPAAGQASYSVERKAIQQRYAVVQVNPKGWVGPYSQPLSEDGGVAALTPRYDGDTVGDVFYWSAASGRVDFPAALLASSLHLMQLSPSGVIAGTVGDTSSRMLPHAFSWSPVSGASRLAELEFEGLLPASYANGVNRSGMIVGVVAGLRSFQQAPPRREHAAYWTGHGGPLALMNEDPALYTFARAVNDAGQAVGRVSVAATGESQGFIWDAAQGLQRIPLLEGAIGGDAVSINQRGEVVARAFYQSASGEQQQRVYLWSAAGGSQVIERDLPFPSNATTPETTVFRLSEGGAVISNAQINSRPFYWQAGSGLRDLLGERGTAGQSKAISPAGTVVGWFQKETEGRQTAFAWSESAGLVDLNDRIDPAAGIHLEDAVAVTDTGLILAVSDSGLVLLSPEASSTAPVSGPIEGVDPVAAGAASTFTVSFTDPDDWDSHRAEWDWGDGSAREAAAIQFAGGSGTATGTHTFAAAGIYEVTLTLRDAAGGSSQSTRKVVVYDPNAGYVAGVGFVTSPPGAHKGKPTTAGRAEFTFVARYLGQGNAPTGATVFRFSAGAMNFVSIRNDWLVVSGSRAQFQGVGRLNGVNDHRFVLTAIDVDGARFSLRSKDRIRMQVWSPAGELVYDNNDPGTTGDEGSLVSGGAIEVVAR